MHLLFVVGHPAHVHLFKNVIRRLAANGHDIVVGAIARETTTRLLGAYGIRHFTFGELRRDTLTKALDLLPKDVALLRFARGFRPDIIISTGSPYAAHVSSILNIPHLAFGDTESATWIARLALPFTDAVCTPAAFVLDLGPKHVRYNGYKELAYLHPTYFTPDPGVLKEVGLSPRENFLLVRFAAWDSSHDRGDRGFAFLNTSQRLNFIRGLEPLGRVLVTSDRGTIPGLEPFETQVQPEKMHDLLSYARLYIGEGATMAAEAGVLGVPWIFVSARGRGFLSDQEQRYGLGHWAKTLDDATAYLPRLTDPGVPDLWKARRNTMLSEKEDVVEFIAGFIENWPAVDFHGSFGPTRLVSR